MVSFEKRNISKKADNLSDWYLDVIREADLADYSDVKGSMIIKPNGYALWEAFQKVIDGYFKEGGVRNAYFPLLIPSNLLKKEKEHLEGFAPELAVVTEAGGEKLAEPLVIRPTSETIIHQSMAKWIQSYRDLPMVLNQWCNVLRWEKRTYPFMRSSEFLWQEGHTAHATKAEAQEMTLQGLEWYRKFYEEVLGVSVYVGIKSETEKFAGAQATYAIEIPMPDGKALQAATSHNLGDNFSKVFDITYLDEKGKSLHPYQTSWGLSTRSIAALIMTHGDDSGLVIPPMIAETKVVLLPIGKMGESGLKEAEEKAREIAGKLSAHGISAKVDTKYDQSLGYRINESEVIGIPLRLEIGGKELEKKIVKYARRDNFEKDDIPENEIVTEVAKILSEIQESLTEKSKKAKDDLTVKVKNYHEFQDVISAGKKFVEVAWCEDSACEAKIKEETKATPRVCELKNIDKKATGKCFHCDKDAKRTWLFAQSY